MSLPASYLLKKTGFKKGMMIGFWAMALGAFIFVPAAYTRTYGVFLLGLFTIGTGLAILANCGEPLHHCTWFKRTRCTAYQSYGHLQ